jgi:hypothetical protein
MATTYQKCDETVRELLDELLEKYRGDLVDAEATIELLFAFGGIRKEGMLVLGRCKINSLQDRAEGKCDVTITLDGDRWPHLPDKRRRALLHHELSHIEDWDVEDHGTDDLGRPALKARHGDWSFDGFDRILDLYGDQSIEHANLAMIAEKHRQMTLPIVLPAGVTVVAGEVMGAGSDRALLLADSDAEVFGVELEIETPAEKVDQVDTWQLFPIDRIPLPPEVRNALQADGVRWAGEWQAGMTNGTLKAFDKLACSVADDAMGALDKAVHHLLPHCRICGYCDENFYEYGLELGPNFIPGETPHLCVDCGSLTSGPPDVDAIPAEVSESTYTHPAVLQKRPLKDPAKQLEKLRQARVEAESVLGATSATYRSGLADWPGPESNCFAPGFEGNPRTRYVGQVRGRIQRVAKAKGDLQLLDAEIAKVEGLVAEAEAVKAMKAKKKATA